jgi:multiple sugar transport system substrate-binding protein
MSRHNTVDRRTLLKMGGVGLATSLAGCSGGGGGGGSEDFAAAAESLGIGDAWRERRFGAVDGWSISDRGNTPTRAEATTWTDSGAFQSAIDGELWRPPEGWEETAAGEVDTLEIVNHGAANMEFDPATLAAHEYFEEVMGIDIEPIEIGVTQANTREQQFLSSEEPSPHAFNVDGLLVPEFVQQGFLEVTDVLYPDGAFDPYIPGLQSLVRWDLDETRDGTHTYGYPNIGEASMGHMRPDLLEEQGIDPTRLEEEGWSWDLLEEIMAAFEGTDVFGYAYYAGTSTYLAISFRELLFQQGGRMVQDDGTVVMNSEEAVRVVRKMKEWRDKGWVPGDVLSYTEGSQIDLFLSGKLAFTTAFSDFVPRSLDQYEAGSEYRVVVPPRANAGPSPTQAGLIAPNSTSINRFSDTGHKLAAMLYGDLKLSYLVQWWEFTYEGNISYASQVYDDASENDFVTFGDAIGNAVENGVLELFPQMQSVFQQMLSPVQRAIQGNITPQAAMDQVQEFVDEEIN